MLINASEYNWAKSAPLKVSLSALEQDIPTGAPVRIYRISGNAQVTLYEASDKATVVYSGSLPWEPELPVACDGLYVVTDRLCDLTVVCEAGTRKIDFTPYLNTSSGMTSVNSAYNDDTTYNTTGMSSFRFNGTAAGTLYINSNHWIGFGTSSEQLKICRRDGCSTAIRRQSGSFADGTTFVKIRFEGYTVYNNRVASNRLIFELFLLSNNDMFLNMVQTPTSGNTGNSEMICNSITTTLTLHDGNGGGPMVSFYHLNSTGKSWNIQYENYRQGDTFTPLYLVKSGNRYYTATDGVLTEIPVTSLTAADFVEYGTTTVPTSTVLLTVESPTVYCWAADTLEDTLQADLVAYPLPSAVECTADMSHPSILGIDMMTAEYSGNVTVSTSLNDGATWSEEEPIATWILKDVDALYESLPESKRLHLRFILHDDATISRFKFTYINS